MYLFIYIFVDRASRFKFLVITNLTHCFMYLFIYIFMYLFIYLYFVDRASPFKFLVITNLTHFFMYLFISCLYMFRASERSSSGDRIVLIHHLVRLVCVSDCLVCRSLRTGIPSSHLHRLIVLDDVLIQFDLLMMSALTLETCRDMK